MSGDSEETADSKIDRLTANYQLPDNYHLSIINYPYPQLTHLPCIGGIDKVALRHQRATVLSYIIKAPGIGASDSRQVPPLISRGEVLISALCLGINNIASYSIRTLKGRQLIFFR